MKALQFSYTSLKRLAGYAGLWETKIWYLVVSMFRGLISLGQSCTLFTTLFRVHMVGGCQKRNEELSVAGGSLTVEGRAVKCE